MGQQIVYEWVIEEVDEYGDIQDVSHADTASDALLRMRGEPDAGLHYEWGLVRDRFHKDDPCELMQRQWAYVEDGALPDFFDEGAKVPARLLAEFARATA